MVAKNLREIIIDRLIGICEETHLKIEIKESAIFIDIVDTDNHEIFHMDNVKIPHIRKDFKYRYKCPIVIEVSTL